MAKSTDEIPREKQLFQQCTISGADGNVDRGVLPCIPPPKVNTLDWLVRLETICKFTVDGVDTDDVINGLAPPPTLSYSPDSWDPTKARVEVPITAERMSEWKDLGWEIKDPQLRTFDVRTYVNIDGKQELPFSGNAGTKHQDTFTKTYYTKVPLSGLESILKKGQEVSASVGIAIYSGPSWVCGNTIPFKIKSKY